MNSILWTPGVTLEHLIEQAVKQAMSFYRNNKTQAASSLGISIRTLDNKLEKYAKDAADHAERLTQVADKRREFDARQRAVPSNGQFDNAATPSIHAAAVAARAARIDAQKGVRAEPIANAPAQQSVSVPERPEIQSVLSETTPSRGNKRTSR